LRFLLDEMYPAAVAAGLRDRGIDAAAVQERPELRGLPDPDLFTAAQLEGRCVVTENLADFIEVQAAWRADQVQPNAGLVLVAPATFPRPHHATIGRLVRALATAESDDLIEPGMVVWLQPADGLT
jgi:hypothetical protein